MKEFYKIGEISALYHIGPDSLRYYEELGILCPKRGANGYRYYSLEDVWRLNVIKDLRALDFSMSSIKEYLDHRSAQSTLSLLRKEQSLIDERIEQLQQQLLTIQSRIKSLEECLRDPADEHPRLLSFPARSALLLRENVRRDAEVDFLFCRLQEQYAAQLTPLGNHVIGATIRRQDALKGGLDHYNAVFFLLEEEELSGGAALPLEAQELFRAGQYLCASCRGPYEHSRALLSAMLESLPARGLALCGDPIELYRIDIHETGRPEEFLTDLQLPVRLL